MHRSYLVAAVGAVGLVLSAGWSKAATPLYSFETLYNNAGAPDPLGTRPDGYFAVGGGTAVVRDTIGTTEGGFSLKFSMVAPATFSGARTAVLKPEINDPATYALVCDVTVTSEFTGAFVRLGITEFGDNEAQFIQGGQAQTTATAEANVDFLPGTYHVTVPLIARGNPITFDPNVPFSTCFGSNPDTQMTPGEFQYYINKSSDAASLVYIDNVRVAKMGDIDGNGKIDADDFALIDRGITRTYPIDSPPGWINGDLNTDGVINAADYAIIDAAYAQQLGAPIAPEVLAAREAQFGPAYAASFVAAVPEPGVAGVALLSLGMLRVRKRR